MSAFLELKDADVISATYTFHPTTTFHVSATSGNNVSQEQFFVLSGAAGDRRIYEDIEGNKVTSSVRLSGSIHFLNDPSSDQKFSFNRLRNIYASNSFAKPSNYTSASIYSASSPSEQNMTLISIPSILYGSEIKSGSFVLSSSVARYYDDGLGGIYSASVLVGSIYYQHGLVHFGHNVSFFTGEPITSSFSGTNKVPVNLYMCSVPRGGANFSNNPSYARFNNETRKSEILTKQPKTFITTVNLYDENYNKVAVAKTGFPILNEESTGIVFRCKLNF